MAERPRVVKLMVDWLVKHLLLVDGSPTLSRFFTFRDKTDAMLLMVLLGMPPQAFTLRSVKPREENQKRMKNVHGFIPAGRGIPAPRTHVLGISAHRRRGAVGQQSPCGGM